MLSYILLFIIIGITIYILPLLLVNGAILGVAVFLSRRKPSRIINLILLIIGLNQLRKGFIFWGIFFLILSIIKFLNLRKINMMKKGNYKERVEQKNKYREHLINKYVKFTDNPMGFVASKIDPMVNEFYDKHNLRSKGEGYAELNKEKNIITLSDRERLGLYRQKEEIKKEVTDEINLAYKRKEYRELENARMYNNVNKNIPSNINEILKTEGDRRYKESLEEMLKDSKKELLTNKSNSEMIKDFIEMSKVDLRSSFEDIFYWDKKEYNEEDYVEYVDNTINNEDYSEKEYDSEEEKDVSWLEKYDIDLNTDIMNIESLNNDFSLENLEKDIKESIIQIDSDIYENKNMYRDKIAEEERNLLISKSRMNENKNIKNQYSRSFNGNEFEYDDDLNINWDDHDVK